MEDANAQQGPATDPPPIGSADLFNETSAAENPLPHQPNGDDPPSSPPNLAGRRNAKYALDRSDIQEIRQQKIADYEFDVLTKDDYLEGLLGAANADLFAIGTALGAEIKEAMTGGMTAKERPRIEAAVDTLLRIDRQIGRFGELGVRAAEARTQAELAKTTLATMTIHGPRFDPDEPLARQKPHIK